MDLQELEDKLQLSAQFGKELLDRNSDLVKQNEEQLQEFSARTEELEQQNHQLRTELRVLKIREKEAQDELREELERNRQAQEQTEAERLLSARSVDDLKQEIEQLLFQLDEKNLIVGQQSKECARQADQISEMQDLLSSYSKSDSEVDNQLMEMQVSLTSEQCQRMELTAQLSEANNQIQRLQLDKTHLSKDLDLLKDSSGEQSKQVSQWSLALENAREEISVLRSQLDAVQSSKDNLSHAATGNSLFGELEDERQKYEAEAATLRVKYRSLEKQHNLQRQQLRQLKAQLHALFQLSRSRADQDELQRLKRKVAESTSVVQTLRARVAQLEDVQDVNDSAEHLRQLRSSFQQTVVDVGSAASNDLYVEFLQRELELVRLREKETRRELDTSRMQLIAEGDKLHQAESQIHQLDVELSKARSASVQARLRLDEISQQQRQQQQPNVKSSRCTHHECKGHECDSMYEHPASPRLMGAGSPIKPTIDKFSTPVPRLSTSSSATQRLSSRRLSSSSSMQKTASSSPRQPLQVLVGKENVPVTRPSLLQSKVQPDPTPVRGTRRLKRQTVRITAEEDSPNECAQQ